MIIIWLISSMSSIPIIISTRYVSTFHKKQGRLVNICFISNREKWQLGYLFVTFVFFYLAPCFVLFVLYGKIVCVIKNRNMLHGANGSRHTRTSFISEKKSLDVKSVRNFTKTQIHKEMNSSDMLACVDQNEKDLVEMKLRKRPAKLPKIKQNQIIALLIVMMFLIMLSLLPYRVFSIWAVLATKEDLKNLGMINYFNLLQFCRVAFYINSALNPIFYHIISTKFRDSFRNFFRCRASLSNRSNQTYRDRISSYRLNNKLNVL